ncbi:MAG: hypothetical protein ACLGQH_12445 [Acidobacteriota bacterium]
MRSAVIRLALVCAVAACLLPMPSLAAPPEVHGGPCRYDVFPGAATFVAVAPLPPAAHGDAVPTPYPPLAVTYRFTPAAPIANEPLYRPDAVHTLTLVNSMPPGPRFVAKYGIAPGAVVPCELHIIRQGTCTPVVHVFPGIDRTDYFELTQQ